MKVDVDELVTGAELARRLGVSRTRQHQLAAQDDFPEALGRIGRAKIWRWGDVEAWARRRGRTLNTA